MNHAARIYATFARALDGFPNGAAMAMLVAEVAILMGCLVGCSATDDRSASWEYISPALFQPNCATASCHSRATAVAGLDFSDADRGYTSLTGLVVLVGDPTGVTPVATNPRPPAAASGGQCTSLNSTPARLQPRAASRRKPTALRWAGSVTGGNP